MGSSPHSSQHISILIVLQQLAFLIALFHIHWVLKMASGLKGSSIDDGLMLHVLAAIAMLVKHQSWLHEHLIHILECMGIIYSCINPLYKQMVMVSSTYIWECELQESLDFLLGRMQSLQQVVLVWRSAHLFRSLQKPWERESLPQAMP